MYYKMAILRLYGNMCTTGTNTSLNVNYGVLIYSIRCEHWILASYVFLFDHPNSVK